MTLANPRTIALLKKIFPYYKWTVYALLFVDILIYLFHEGNLEAVQDSVGWLILLLVFEWETSQMDKPYTSKFEKYGLRILTIVCYIVLVAAAIEYSSSGYIDEEGRLDMWNAWTWLLVVIVLEYDVYAPGLYSRKEWYIRNGVKTILYVALIVYAVLWGIRGNALDFWDAFLWILCFFSIEMNVLEFEEEVPYEEEVQAAVMAAKQEEGKISGKQ